MEVIIYTAIFLTGIVFGSFFTLAVYRIPRKENIVYGRSHCTSCNHKLGFWDLIPILSYVFLKGRCRYCGEKIRIRYLLLEIFSGSVFLLIALTHGTEDIIMLCLIYLFIAGMFIIAGIDKERYEIPNGLCLYVLVVSIANFSYQLFIGGNYENYLIGIFMIPLIIFIINKSLYFLNKDESKISIGYGNIKYLALIGFMFGYKIQILAIIFSIIILLIGNMIHKYKKIPWGYYLSIATITIIIVEPYMSNFLELM